MEVLIQLWDFLLKAAVAYVQTPEGQKELDDIEAAVADVVGDMLPFDAPAEVNPQTAPRARSQGDPSRFKKRPVRGQ